ncbi:MAG TPA: ankyrin repeat domain-containing protein [Steroidobacteraceae bacterium]|nr:ankyrin repeat domain-containing protein [Steroidobacteraceae bacterium]
MTTSQTLPARPDLEHLKKQARQLLRDVRTRQGEALQTIAAFHPRPAEFGGLRDAQLVIARRYGFSDWGQLRNEVELRQLRAASSRERAERIVQHACLRYDGDDQAWRYERASRWLGEFPELTRDDFHCALVAADLEAVRGFLREDPTLAVRNGGPRGWPALLYLTYSRLEQSRQHAAAVARLLLEAGASADSRTDNPGGFTAVTGAVGGGERGPMACTPHPCADELVALLLDAGANPNQSQALYNAMLGEHLDKWLRVFIAHGLKAGDRANWSNDDEEPILDFLLSFVVTQGRDDLARYLLEQGANPNAVSRYHHRSAHIMAQLTQRTDIAELLRQFGATPEPLSVEDQFRLACGRHERTLAEELLQQHPQLLQDPQLFRDCAMTDTETCLWLVRRGYDMNARDASGRTVLHNYALRNDAAAVATLLRNGVDPHLKEYNWQATALGLALHHRHWPVVEVLLPVSRDLFDVCRVADAKRAAELLAAEPGLIGQRTPKGNTALHVVSQAKQEEPDVGASVATIEVLLKNGADRNARNDENKTAAQWYRQLGMDELAEFLEG